MKQTEETIYATARIQDDQINGKYIYYRKYYDFSVNYTEPLQRIYIIKYIKDRIYASDNASVLITVGNSGETTIYSIHVYDNLGNILIPYSNQNWEYTDIKVGQQVEVRYPAVVNQIGHYTIPAATVTFDYKGQPQTLKSNTVTIDTIDVTSGRKKLPTSYQAPTPIQTSTPIVTEIPTIIPTPVETKSVITIITPTPTTPIPIIPPSNLPQSNKYYSMSGFDGIFLIVIILFVSRITN